MRWERVSVLIVSLITIISAWLTISKPEAPPAYQIQGFEFILQPDDISCGPTSATMLLRMYGKDASVDQVRIRTKTDWCEYDGQQIGMTSPSYLPSALKAWGLPAKKMRGDLDDIRHYVSERRPPIVLVRTGRFLWHYVVVIGYNETSVILADPARGRRVVPLEVFESSWNFRTDLYGNVTMPKCPICGGSGRIGSINLGPLNRCEFCDGEGIMTDVVSGMLQSLEVYPETMIVPELNMPD